MKIKNLIKLSVVVIGVIMAAFVSAAQNVVAPLASRTAAYTSATINRTTEHAVHFVINTTAVTGGQSITPTVYGIDALGNSYPILVGTAITATGITVLKIVPGAVSIPNGAASDVLPDQYYIGVAVSSSSSFIYSITANQE